MDYMWKKFSPPQTAYPLDLWISSGEWHWGESALKFGILQPGKYYYKLTKTVYKRLPHPYSDCVQNGSPEHLSKSMFSGPYTIKKCIDTCKAKMDLENCGFIMNLFRTYARDSGYIAQLKNKTMTEFKQCVTDMGNKQKNLTHSCVAGCNEPCDEIKYDVSETFFPETFLQWEVSFKDFQVREIGQEPSYDETSLIANFGGTLGLMCGMSAVSILELLIWTLLSISIFTYYSYKKCQKRFSKIV